MNPDHEHNLWMFEWCEHSDNQYPVMRKRKVEHFDIFKQGENATLLPKESTSK